MVLDHFTGAVMASTLSSVTSCMQIRAQFRLFQEKAMFKQHMNLIIWTWILQLQTASRNEFLAQECSIIIGWITLPIGGHRFLSNGHGCFLQLLISSSALSWKQTIWTLSKGYQQQGTKYFNIALVLQDEWLTIFTCPANTCTCPLKAYAIKNTRE